jgi:hypothetical protein
MAFIVPEIRSPDKGRQTTNLPSRHIVCRSPNIGSGSQTKLAAGIFLRRNGFRLTASDADLVKIAMGVARSQFSLEEIVAWLPENSQPIR